MRILYHDSIRDDPEAIARASEVSSGGAQARTTLTRLPAMVISDRETAVVFPDLADATAVTTWTSEAAIISALAALFDQAWHAATPLAAARRLGLSLRTTRRHMATLMSQLDAISRFQASAEAAKRGWLALLVLGWRAAAIALVPQGDAQGQARQPEASCQPPITSPPADQGDHDGHHGAHQEQEPGAHQEVSRGSVPVHIALLRIVLVRSLLAYVSSPWPH